MNAFARKVRRQQERKLTKAARLDERTGEVRRGRVAAIVFALIGAALLAAVLAFTSCAHSAVLKVSCSAPMWNNAAASCGSSPILSAGSDSVRVTIEVSALGLRDSATVARGQRATFLFQPVPPGSYAVRAFASRVIGGFAIPGCDTIATVPTIAPAGVIPNLGQ